MILKFTDNYDKTIKKLKKHEKELDNLNKIIKLLESVNNFNDVVHNPIFSMYGFERLKYEYNSFYSFNLSKNSGTIRLIVKPSDNILELYLVHISYNHYVDFNIEKGDIDE